MNPPDEFLSDVFGEPDEFRAALLEQTLRQVRRRRLFRHCKQGFAAVAGVVAVAFVCWRTVQPTALRLPAKAPDLVVIRSQPLPPSMIVETRPGVAGVVVSSASTYALVETGASKRLFREIDDEQLLALLSGKPAALVRRGPNQVELIFLNPEDEKGFPVQ
jgi:hypothetical protein